MKKGLIFILSVGAIFSASLFAETESVGELAWDNWKSKTVECTVTVTTTIGGGPIPFSYTISTTYEGTMRRCVSGWGFCAWNGSCG